METLTGNLTAFTKYVSNDQGNSSTDPMPSRDIPFSSLGVSVDGLGSLEKGREGVWEAASLGSLWICLSLVRQNTVKFNKHREVNFLLTDGLQGTAEAVSPLQASPQGSGKLPGAGGVSSVCTPLAPQLRDPQKAACPGFYTSEQEVCWAKALKDILCVGGAGESLN